MLFAKVILKQSITVFHNCLPKTDKIRAMWKTNVIFNFSSYRILDSFDNDNDEAK